MTAVIEGFRGKKGTITLVRKGGLYYPLQQNKVQSYYRLYRKES